MQKVIRVCANLEEYLCDNHTLQLAMRDTFVQVYGMKRILKIHFLKQSSSETTAASDYCSNWRDANY